MTDLLIQLGNLALIPLTLSLGLVILVRKPLRARLGSSRTYLLWAIPPSSLLAAVAPNQHVASEAMLISSERGFSASLAGGEALHAGTTALEALSVLWVVGSFVCASGMILAYRRFLSRVGPFSPISAEIDIAHGQLDSPALMGLWQPRIVVPSNFDERFDERQRKMIIEHERQHRRRGDHWANVAAAALQCLFWFHPLIWWAGRAFRVDQEMACDAAVLRHFPQWPQSYAKALIPQLRPQAPGTCQWSAHGALKERIEMIDQSSRFQHNSFAGLIFVAILVLAMTATVWSTTAFSDNDTARLYFTIQSKISAEDGSLHEHHFVIGTSRGEPASMTTELTGGESVRYELRYDLRDENLVDLSMRIARNDRQIGTPRIVFKIDSPEGARIAMGEPDGSTRYEMDIRASRTRPEGE
ncbi:MAG: M56 family metallopeptidase [Xanthomonadales bacterium]|nr:M56 family metallopeptidase [Xanthomonadales bacterium]